MTAGLGIHEKMSVRGAQLSANIVKCKDPALSSFSVCVRLLRKWSFSLSLYLPISLCPIYKKVEAGDKKREKMVTGSN